MRGTGALGWRIAEWLRARHPALPIAIAARDQARARQFAEALGQAEAVGWVFGRILEEGPASQVLGAPRHPYLASVPRLGAVTPDHEVACHLVAEDRPT